MQGIEILGYKEAIAVLDQLTDQMRKVIVRRTLRKSARQMLSMAKNAAPKRKGTLSKSIRFISLRRDRVPTVIPMGIAPVFDVTKNGKLNAFYARFVHEGTRDRRPRAVTRKKSKGGSRVLVFTSARGEKVFARSARGIAPNPFLQRAFDAATDTTVDSFGRELASEIERFIDKNFVKI